ncbi:hypothetical protein [Pseudomonas sp.]|uniref:hypothetical protein n=1 Tax=Pseudomonas sp. TaxID=306 RepID=UPI003FD73EF7
MIERDEFRELEKVVDATDRNVIRLQEQVTSLQQKIVELVSKAEFAPVKLIAYGLATAVGSSVIMAILAKVIIK